MNTSTGGPNDANAAHQEYLAEAKRLVDEQAEALFARIEAIAARAPSTTSATGIARPEVARDGHTLRVATGPRAITFNVEAITDLPDDVDRAQVFPISQARCVARAPEGMVAEWDLHRLGEGSSAPSYTWMHAQTGAPVSDEDIAQLLQGAPS